jgi:hypothetical protein
MKLSLQIEKSENFFARARVRKYSSAIALSARHFGFSKCQALWILRILLIGFAPMIGFAQESQTILGTDSRVHGFVLDHSQEPATRDDMGIADTCDWIKAKATSLALVGSEGASVDPRIKAKRGMIVLEGLIPGSTPKILDTEFLTPYQNYATSIPGDIGMQPGPRYPLAVTMAATIAGQGDLMIQKGDYLIVHADGQLYSYSLPDLTIPSDGILRLYLGTDDTLYYDTKLTHPVHSGACGRKAS